MDVLYSQIKNGMVSLFPLFIKAEKIRTEPDRDKMGRSFGNSSGVHVWYIRPHLAVLLHRIDSPFYE